MITIRYEKLLVDTTSELQRICDFAGLECEPTRLKSIAENASFENMRLRERRLGWESKAWPSDRDFIRRGKAGSFEDEMPREALEEFVRLAMPTLKRLGYP
jgi:hypothetical protein